MLKEIPKATNGGANQYQAKFAAVRNEQKPKADVLTELGISKFAPMRIMKQAIVRRGTMRYGIARRVRRASA